MGKYMEDGLFSVRMRRRQARGLVGGGGPQRTGDGDNSANVKGLGKGLKPGECMGERSWA